MTRHERIAAKLHARGRPLPLDLIVALLAQGIDPSIYS
jgi:hypothetical protein